MGKDIAKGIGKEKRGCERDIKLFYEGGEGGLHERDNNSEGFIYMQYKSVG